MCFSNDYDWYASLVEQEEIENPKECHCHECGRKMAAGEMVHHTYQQEHEMCQICEDDSSYRFDETADKGTCDHNFGETYDYWCCLPCWHVRQGIISREKKEGCPADAQQPYLGQLVEAFASYDDNRWDYADECLSLFPELIEHPFIAKMLVD